MAEQEEPVMRRVALTIITPGMDTCIEGDKFSVMLARFLKWRRTL